MSAYSVRIEYQEPTYAARGGKAPRSYRSTFRIRATSAEEAARLAMNEFRHFERISSVGWAREVVRVVTTEEAAA